MNLPEAFERKMKNLLGDEYEDYLKCFDEPRHFGLRVNTSKISVENFQKISPMMVKNTSPQSIPIILPVCIIFRNQAL